MAALAVATAVRTGIDMTGVACSGGGDTFLNSGQEVLFVTNGDGSSHTVTVAFEGTGPDGLTVTSRVVTVAAGKTEAIGPFNQSQYSDPATGLVNIAYSAVTSMTAKVLKVTPA